MAITIWSKNKSSNSVLSSLHLDDGQYEFVFSSNVLSRATILEFVKPRFGTGFAHVKIGGKNIQVVSTEERKEDFSIFVNVDTFDQKEVDASFISISIALGALGIIAIIFLVEVKKTFTGKTGFLSALVIFGILGTAFYFGKKL